MTWVNGEPLWFQGLGHAKQAHALSATTPTWRKLNDLRNSKAIFPQNEWLKGSIFVVDSNSYCGQGLKMTCV